MRLELPIIIVTAMVSPKARPKANIIPPTIPEKAAGINTRKIVSQRVAPKPREACRKSGGKAAKESREIAIIIGRIIIAKITPAGNIPGPPKGVLKRGIQLKLAFSQLPRGLMIGISTNIPHNP